MFSRIHALTALLQARAGISSAIAGRIGALFLANAANSGVSFLTNLLIAKHYSHEVFGAFSLATNIAATLYMLMEVGVSQGMIKIFRDDRNSTDRKRAVFWFNLIIKISSLTMISLAIPIVNRYFSHWSQANHLSELMLAFALLTGGFLGLWGMLKSIFQATDRYGAIIALTLIYATTRLIYLTCTILYFRDQPPDLMFFGAHLFPIILLVFVGGWLAAREFKVSRAIFSSLIVTAKQCVRYSRWLAISGLAYALILQTLVFFTASYYGIKQVSLLGVSLSFAGIFNMVGDAIVQVLFPKAAGMTASSTGNFIKNLNKAVPIFFIASVLLVGALSAIMYFYLGDKYTESLPIFWIISLGSFIATTIAFYSILLHTFDKPHTITIINAFYSALFVVGLLVCGRRVDFMIMVLLYSITLIFLETTKMLSMVYYRRQVTTIG